MNCLVAEDEPANRLLLQTFLSRFGHCDVVSNGQEAVAAVKRAMTQKCDYALILMDLCMPVMDGHQALRAIRQIEEVHGVLEPVTILVTTAMTDLGNITRALRNKCNGYLMKPVDLSVLTHELQDRRLIPDEQGL